MSDWLWELKDVSLVGTHQPRLDGVSIQIPPGITAVLGYSGAGKTSLLNILAGMEAGQTGQISGPRAGRGAVPLFWVPQDGGLWPHLTCVDHLRAVLPPPATVAEANLPWPTDSAAAVDKILAGFDLLERAEAVPAELSQGEQARLSLARCLAACPAVLLMDEPLAHVDPVRRLKYWHMIRDYLKTTAAALVFSTHQPETAIREAAHVVCLEEGRVIYAGDLPTLYRSPPSETAGAFLGPLNWFDSAAAHVWLQRSEAAVLRPEELSLVADRDGPFEVLSFRFSGSYSETELRSVKASPPTSRVLVHRSSDALFQSGQRVRLQW